ncbi:hypothetical protein ACFX13_030918 [Malus domestica]
MSRDETKSDVEDLGLGFRSKLRLSEKERGGIYIERKDVEGALLGLQYTMIAEVLTSKVVNGEVFVDCFMSLWRGREGVSIRDIGENRFLARFASQQDLLRVVEADQPWFFKGDLVMVADRSAKGLNRWTLLHLGTFWVQVHNVPILSMTQAVAESIGGLMGTVRKVDKSGSRDCIGRFLRVKIRFNVREPLMRGTFVDFPDDGRIWVDFRYEALPKYCLMCGMLGHTTRACTETREEGAKEGESSGELNDGLGFKGLDAVIDLRGNHIGPWTRSKGSRGSNGGGNETGKWKNKRQDEQDEGRRSDRSSTASSMGSRSQYGGHTPQSENEHTDLGNEEENDTATSPSKPRWSSSKTDRGGSKLADKIRSQRIEEENARQARESAFDAGLIGPGGVIADNAKHITLHEPPEQEARLTVASLSSDQGQSFDLNSEPLVVEDNDDEEINTEVSFEGQKREATNTAETRELEDDPFELVPIIEAVMNESKRKKRTFKDVEHISVEKGVELKRSKIRKSLVAEAEGTSRKGSPTAP